MEHQNGEKTERLATLDEQMEIAAIELEIANTKYLSLVLARIALKDEERHHE